MTRLLLLAVRRDRVHVLVWVLITGVLSYSSVTAVAAEFGTEADRAGLVRLAVATPSLLALRGVPDGASLGSYVFFQIFTYLALVAGFMSVFLVTRHTRGDEERGRRELLDAVTRRRTDSLAAAVVWGVVANILLGVAVAVGFLLGGLPVLGSWLAAAAVVGVGWCFVGCAAFVAEASPTGRSANGIGSALLGVAFMLRAVGDATGTASTDGLSVVSAWPSWLSPIGWGQQTFAFTRADPLPLLLAFGFAVLSGGAALVVRRSRDLGASLVRERPGPARAGARFRSNLALVWRLQRGTLGGWIVGGVVLGLLAGALAGRLVDASGSGSAQLTEVIGSLVPGGGGGIEDLFVVAIMTIAGVLAAGAAVQAIVRSRSEEADGRTELILQSAVPRTRWFLDTMVAALLSAVAVMVATGVAGGLTFLVGGAETSRSWSTVAAALVQVPAAASVAALTGLVWMLAPRATIAVGWGALGAAYLLAQLGGLLRLPQWLRDVSPFSHTPVLPGPDPQWTGAMVLVAITIAGTVVGALLARRRQLVT